MSFGGFGKMASGALESATKVATSTATSASNAAKSAAGTAGQFAGDTANAAKGAASSAGQFASDTASGAANTTRNAAEAAFNATKHATEAAGNTARSSAATAGDTAKGAATGASNMAAGVASTAVSGARSAGAFTAKGARAVADGASALVLSSVTLVQSTAGAIYQNGHAVLRGRPCVVTDKQEEKDAEGRTYYNITGKDVTDGETVKEKLGEKDPVQVPEIVSLPYRLVSIEDDGATLVLRNEQGDEKRLPVPDNQIGSNIRDLHKDGAGVQVKLIEAQGQYIVSDYEQERQ